MSDNYYLACEVQNNYKFSMYRIKSIYLLKRKILHLFMIWIF